MTTGLQEPGTAGGPRGTDAAAIAHLETADGTALSHACAQETTGGVADSAHSRGPGRARLVGVDAARGVALVGMMAVHTMSPTDSDGSLSLAWTLAAGKSAALFALLAGVGVAFASGGRRRPSGRSWKAQSAALLVRALLIGSLGLLLGYAVADGDAAVILPYYALLFVLAIPLLTLSTRTLALLAAVIGVGMPLLSHWVRSGSELVTVPNPTFTDLVDHPVQLLRELALTGVYPALPWMAYLCAGLAVGRALVSSRLTAAVLTGIGGALMAASTAISWLLLDFLDGRATLEQVALGSMSQSELDGLLLEGPSGTTPADTWWWMATMTPHSSTPLDIAFTIGVGLAVLGVLLLFGRALPGLLRPIAAAGSMSLTLYAAHLLLLGVPALPGGPVDLAIQTVALVAFALVWSRFRARGPLEDVVARTTGAVRRRVLAPAAASRDGSGG